MSEDAVGAAGEPEEKRRFTLPSAYTILFVLIVLAAIATWIIPAGTYELNKAGEPKPEIATAANQNAVSGIGPSK